MDKGIRIISFADNRSHLKVYSQWKCEGFLTFTNINTNTSTYSHKTVYLQPPIYEDKYWILDFVRLKMTQNGLHSVTGSSHLQTWMRVLS